jgi:hypothetical protein
MIRALLVLLVWAGGIFCARLFVAYSTYSDLHTGALLVAAGAWLSAISYIIVEDLK